MRVGILACGRARSEMAQSPRTTATTGRRPQRSRARLGTRRRPTKPGRNSPTWPAPQPITSSISTASSNADCGSARISLNPPALERSRAGVACIYTVGGIERATRAGGARAFRKSRRLPWIARVGPRLPPGGPARLGAEMNARVLHCRLCHTPRGSPIVVHSCRRRYTGPITRQTIQPGAPRGLNTAPRP